MTKYQYTHSATAKRAGNARYEFTCVGSRYDDSTPTEATRECVDTCPFVEYGKGEDWTDDYVRCAFPGKVVPGERVSVKTTRTIRKDKK